MARVAPTARDARNCSSASDGPSVSRVSSPPICSMSWTPASTAFSSCGEIPNPRNLVSISCLSGVRISVPPASGTRLRQTRIFIKRGFFRLRSQRVVLRQQLRLCMGTARQDTQRGTSHLRPQALLEGRTSMHAFQVMEQIQRL